MTHFKWVIQDVASQGDVSQNAIRQNGIIAVLSFLCSVSLIIILWCPGCYGRYTDHSLVLNRTCQVPSAKLRLMARWKGELTGFQNRYRWPRESTRSMNASRFNPGTA